MADQNAGQLPDNGIGHPVYVEPPNANRRGVYSSDPAAALAEARADSGPAYDQTAAKAASLAASQKRQALIGDPRNQSSKPFTPDGE
jgi:hypothetical protein